MSAFNTQIFELEEMVENSPIYKLRHEVDKRSLVESLMEGVVISKTFFKSFFNDKKGFGLFVKRLYDWDRLTKQRKVQVNVRDFLYELLDGGLTRFTYIDGKLYVAMKEYVCETEGWGRIKGCEFDWRPLTIQH